GHVHQRLQSASAAVECRGGFCGDRWPEFRSYRLGGDRRQRPGLLQLQQQPGWHRHPASIRDQPRREHQLQFSDGNLDGQLRARRGAFVISDLKDVPNGNVYWWGAQWWKQDHLRGGLAPASFKGYENGK